MDKETVLVTGGAGFIGSHLSDALVRKGYHVRIFDNLIRGKLENVQHLLDAKQAEFLKGDVRDKETVREAMKGVSYVFHEASDSINKSLAFPQESFDINLNGTYTVCMAAAEANVKKLMYAGSASVYGEPKRLPMKETDSLNPVTPYCISKLCAEFIIRSFARQNKLHHIILRYFNVYGLRQNIDAHYTAPVIIFIKRLMSRQAPVIHGSGEQAMDFIKLKDIVQANICAMESDVQDETFNVGTGRLTSIKEIAESLVKIVNVNLTPIYEPRPTIVSKRKADISKIRDMLGFTPHISIEEGLQEIVKDMAAHPDKY